MNENELCARWLEILIEVEMPKDVGPNSLFYANYVAIKNHAAKQLPNFRASNEWAGALLTKMWEEDPYRTAAKINPLVHAGSWRDAVVDAVLELIRQAEGNSNG